MKRIIVTTSLAVFVSSLFAIGIALKGPVAGRGSLVTSVQAKDKENHLNDDDNRGGCRTNCSLHSLKGCFGSTITGNLVGGPLAGPVAGIVLQKFDGEGGLTQVDTVSINGTLIANERSATGTYTVNPDCTGSATIDFPEQPPLQLNFVLVDHGRELRAVTTNPGLTTTSVGRKQ